MASKKKWNKLKNSYLWRAMQKDDGSFKCKLVAFFTKSCRNKNKRIEDWMYD